MRALAAMLVMLTACAAPRPPVTTVQPYRRGPLAVNRASSPTPVTTVRPLGGGQYRITVECGAAGCADDTWVRAANDHCAAAGHRGYALVDRSDDTRPPRRLPLAVPPGPQARVAGIIYCLER